MEIKPSRTESDYQSALKEIEGLMDARPDTPEGDRLDVMTTLVEAFEAKHYPIEAPDPIEAILTEMPKGSDRLTPYDPEFEAQMKLAEEGMARYRNTLHTLAK